MKESSWFKIGFFRCNPTQTEITYFIFFKVSLDVATDIYSVDDFCKNTKQIYVSSPFRL